nr:ribonuclease H-like domain-containing protein [Tanacetum cinerariifolium]
MNGDARYRNMDNNKRTVPIESSDALVVQDTALIVQDGFQLRAKDKTGLGYGDQLSESDSEVLPSVFDSRSSDDDDNPTNDRNESVKSDKQVDKPKMVTQNSKADRKDWNMGNPQQALKYKGMFDSGCSRHMTGNKALLTDYQDIDGGFVAFGGSTKGGKIIGIGKIRSNKIDFKDVFFVKEQKFNLFFVSQICDKKNSVLFIESECLVLSPDFKLLDESQVLIRVPRQNNIYNFDLKNIVPSEDLTCLFAKAIIDESNLWHMRLGHVNFKTMNKLVKGNLVRDLPSKTLENDHTCVACQKGKQHKASFILVSSNSSEDSVGTPAGRVTLFGTIPTTILDTTPVITPPTTQTDNTVIPTETPIIAPTIPPSPDYTPASPDYSPPSETESDPSEDPSSGHIPPLPARSPVIPRRRVMILAPRQPIPHGRPYCYHPNGSLMTSVPTLPPVSGALSHVHTDLIPSPKRVMDIGYLVDVEVMYETLGDLVQRFHDHTQAIPVYRVLVIEGVQREQGHRIVGVESAVAALTERVTELERVISHYPKILPNAMLLCYRKMLNTLSRAFITHDEVEELVARRVAKEIEARKAARNLETLNENKDEQEGENGGNENRGNRGNRNGDNGGNEIEETEEMEMEGMEKIGIMA